MKIKTYWYVRLLSSGRQQEKALKLVETKLEIKAKLLKGSYVNAFVAGIQPSDQIQLFIN